MKTLHPRIHAGILVRRGRDDDAAALSEHSIEPFDLVCVNLYPFELAVDRPELDETALIEMIDVGGPALLRAAKNFASVTVVVRARDYDTVLDELRASGATTPELRRRLAATFARSAAYEAAIARWFQQDAGFPETLVPAFDRVRELPAVNPHQRAACTHAERGARTHLLGFVRQHQGKDLSFNNLGDLSAARLLTGRLERPACVIVKHANPCGALRRPSRRHTRKPWLRIRCRPTAASSWSTARSPRRWPPRSRRSSSKSCSHPRTRQTRSIGSREKPGLRVLEHTDQRAPEEAERDYRRSSGPPRPGSRSRDRRSGEPQVVCGDVSGAQWDDLFAWCVVKHVTSNAIVLARAVRRSGSGRVR